MIHYSNVFVRFLRNVDKKVTKLHLIFFVKPTFWQLFSIYKGLIVKTQFFILFLTCVLNRKLYQIYYLFLALHRRNTFNLRCIFNQATARRLCYFFLFFLFSKYCKIKLKKFSGYFIVLSFGIYFCLLLSDSLLFTVIVYRQTLLLFSLYKHKFVVFINIFICFIFF